MSDPIQEKTELIKNIDSFFGYKVKESIVLLFVGEDHSINYNIRVDLDDNGLSSIPEILAKVTLKEGDLGVICIVFSEDIELAQNALLQTMRFVLLVGGTPYEAIVCDGTKWESLTGDSGVIDNLPSDLEYWRAEKGIFNYPSREEAIAQFHVKKPSDGVMQEIYNIMDAHTADRKSVSLWRKKVVDFIRSYRHEDITDEQVAFLAFAAADQITSKILIKEVTGTKHPAAVLQLWQDVFQRTPEDYRFAVGEILAWALAIEGSRSFIPEVIPYCNQYSATFQALMIAMDMKMTSHMMAMAIEKKLHISDDTYDDILLPMVSSAVKYMVDKHQKDL